MVTCSSCGVENPTGFRFCGGCGSVLVAEAAPPGEERKVVSVLFVDLVGFTAQSEFADPEEVRATLRPYHARLRQEIERFGGTVEKFVGDAVMAVFGAPRAHEDDAERAVRAGLRVLEAMQDLNAGRSEPLAVRAAVNTGEALVALAARPELGEGFVTGDVVNTASRLQGAAPLGSLVVGELTYRATRDAVIYEELEPVSVKGKTQAVALWRAVEARSRFGVDVGQGRGTPLVGRAHELSLLREVYARALREPSLQLVTVTGEPGVGKSRLVAEFFAFIDERDELVFWRQGRCLPYGEGITFWALGEIVKAHAGILESDDPASVSRKLADALAGLIDDSGERDWLQGSLLALTGAAEGAAEREELFTAWTRFLEAVAAKGPLVLVVEDMHWGDEALLDFLEYLADWSQGLPIVLLCLARPEFYERRPAWGGGRRNSTTLGLQPLSPQETSRLVSALLDRSVLPAETQQLLLERSGGNPLYAAEFIRTLRERGVLTRQGALPADEALDLPEGIHALIAARLDGLPAEQKGLLQDAAVVGKVFWAGAVAAMAKRDEASVREALQSFSRREFVQRARMSSVAGEVEYAFTHGLVRDVAYGQIPRAARARRHRAAAEWITSMAGERVGDHAELLAHHYGEALVLAAAADDHSLAQDLRPLAGRFMALAADRLVSLDLPKADAYYRRALELVTPEERAPLLTRAADAAHLAGELDEAIAMYRNAMTAFAERGDVLGRLEPMARLARLLINEGAQRSELDPLVDELIAYADALPESAAAVGAYRVVGFRALFDADLDSAIGWFDRAVSLAEELGVSEVRLQARMNRAWALWEYGKATESLLELRAVLQAARSEGIASASSVAWSNLAYFSAIAEGPEPALDAARAGIEYALRRGLRSEVMWMRGESLWAHLDAGDWEEVLETGDEVARWADERGAKALLLTALAPQLVVSAARADSRAGELAARVVQLARDLKRSQADIAPVFSAAIMAQLIRRETAAAALLAEELEERAKTPGWRMHGVAAAAQAYVEANQLSRAEALLAVAAEPSAGRHRAALASARAIVAEARGELDAALELYGKAAELWRNFGAKLEEALALTGQARLASALGEKQRARKRERSAEGILTSLEAVALLARAPDQHASAGTG